MKKINALAIAFSLIIIALQAISVQVELAHAVDSEYYLFVNIVGNGIVTYNGSNPYAAGDVVQLAAYAVEGWVFSGWGGDLGGSTTPEFLTMNSNKTVTATFTQIPEYYLKVNIVGSGIVTVNGSSPYVAGSVVKITAYPSSDWEFAGWSGDLGGSTTPEYLTMDSNKTVTATFTQIPKYILQVNIIGSGVVSVNGSSPYDAGDTVKMTAYPSSGWEFAGWSVALVSMNNPEYLLMDGNKAVNATFTQIPKTIESCDSVGNKKDTFLLGDDVYGNGTGYRPQTTYDIYVVEDVTWVDGMAIPPRVAGTATTVTTDANGNIPPTLLWSNPLTLGKYDILVDVDGDGLYYAEADALDDSDVEVTAGFFVIPELPLGTVLAATSMFVALGGYLRFKRIRLK